MIATILNIVTFVFIGSLAQASGTTVGNGGESVVCRDSKGTLTSIEILDSFESRVLDGLKISLPGNSADAKAELEIRRLMNRNPTRAKLYLLWLNNFMSGVTFVEGPLPTTPDVDPSIFPKGCGIEQIAVQDPSLKNNEGGPILKIDKSLWQSLSEEQKAILIVHEIIYHESHFNDYSTKSARPIRQFNAILFSDTLQNLNDYDYLRLLKQLEMSEWDHHGLRIQISSDSVLEYLVCDQSYSFQGRTIILKGDTLVYFDNNKLFGATLAAPNRLDTSLGPILATGDFLLDDQGYFTGSLAQATDILTKFGWSVPCAKDSKLKFSGQLFSCSELTLGMSLKGPWATLNVLQSGTFTLDQTGRWADFEKTGHYSATPIFNGAITINGTHFDLSSFTKPLLSYHFEGDLARPQQFQLLGADVTAINHIIFSYQPFDKTKVEPYIDSFQPQGDFFANSNTLTYPVAAQSKCYKWSSERIVQNRVELDYQGNIYRFVLSKDWTPPDGSVAPHEGKNEKVLKKGTILSNVTNYINVEGNVCDQ